MKSVLYALGANFGVFLAKVGATVVTGSSAMLAEAIHSLADCGNQVLLLWGMKRAKRAPDADHPLGYGKAIYFWSFVVALLLFFVGGMFSVYEGWHKLHAPEPVSAPWVAIGVLALAILLEGFALRGCLREINKVRGDRSLWLWFRESRQSELVVILGEDVAALLGLTFALGAILLTIATGNPIFDAAGTLGIGLLLVVVAIGVAVEVKALLVGQSAEPAVRAQIEDFVRRHPHVDHLFRLITLHLGDDLMIALKARMKETGSALALIAAINETEAAIRAEFPQVRWLFFEPDVDD